jgi:tetratricopeptide (TPR) repeat protein
LAGRIDDALGVCDRAARELADTDSPREAMALRLYWSWILTIRGEFEQAMALVDQTLPVARGAEPSALVEALLVAIDCAKGQGKADAATTFTDELLRTLDDPAGDADLGQDLRLLGRILAPIGHGSLLARIIAHTPGGIAFYDHNILSARAAIALAEGEHRLARDLHGAAAAAWSSYRCPIEQAQALLGEARCSLAMGQPAQRPLLAARALLTALQATPLVAEVDTLLRQSTGENH